MITMYAIDSGSAPNAVCASDCNIDPHSQGKKICNPSRRTISGRNKVDIPLTKASSSSSEMTISLSTILYDCCSDDICTRNLERLKELAYE